MPGKPRDELLDVIHLLSKATKIIGEQEGKLSSLAKELKSSVTSEEYTKIIEERNSLEANLNHANKRIPELENQLSATLKELRSHRDSSELTTRLQSQALAEAREEANRWHEQCTRMEQGREVRASHIDALIEALHAQHSTVSRSYGNPTLVNHDFPLSQMGHSSGPATKAESDVPEFGDPFRPIVARPATHNVGDVVHDPRRFSGSFHPHTCGRQLEGSYSTERDIIGENSDSDADEMAIIPSSRRKRESASQTLGHPMTESRHQIPMPFVSTGNSKKRKAPHPMNQKKAKR